ncbi:competence protein ComK [Bacillus sp. CMF21]|uniref:competence protein ComK n=1 Tax=Metabacillus dongyingensis TaxID=2874282 RepID=UPI001CC04BC3|nr:competence protein ComK [Metabacillus dongyingensis]UOK58767.1 competence protein ComK [Bacillus sp. OVS6]USK29540.1 competence protein ComK [Bacillus sp. CMF21]
MGNEQEEYLDNYIANRFTMAILPEVHKGRLYSRVIEVEKELFVKLSPQDIVNRSCSYFGSSYEGRKAGTKDLMGITHKPPIVIDPGNYMFFFPTSSSSRRQCAWISHAHILQYKAADFDNTEIFFTNGSSETISVSSTSFENQLYRTAQLRTIITARIEEEHRKMNLLLFPKEKQTNLIYEQIIRELNKH